MTPTEAAEALLRRIRDLLEEHGVGSEFDHNQQAMAEVSAIEDGEFLVDGLGRMTLLIVSVKAD